MTDADPAPSGAVEIRAVTDREGASACPDCGTGSSRVHETVVTCPKDVRRAGDPVEPNWVKRRLKCVNDSCRRRTFTERVPAVPPGCRVLPRLKDQCAGEVADRGVTPAEAARHAGVSLPVARAAFTAKADAMLEPAPGPAVHLGIDERRRGRARWRRDEETGQYVTVADRRHVNFRDLGGKQGLLGQVEGRTADDAAYWLPGAPPAWRDRAEVAAIDMCTVFAAAVRRALPQARVAVDLFHVVQLAVKALGDVRRRATREKYGRRSKKGDPEHGSKACPAATWRTCPGRNPRRSSRPSTPTATASRSCSPVRLLRLVRPGRGRPELTTLASTISRWEDEIVTAVLTGVTNATSESLNRIAKLEARPAYGFRNPENQRRRVRIACTRGTRRRSPTATSTQKQPVTSRKQDPG